LITRKSLLLSLLAAAAPSPALAQEAPPPAAAQPATEPEPVEEDELGEEEAEIVVTGRRQRGAVDSDIPPEVQLNPREIRALGAGSLAEVLEALAPQTRSGRGRGDGAPVVLLNGRRISGFAEIRDIPPEAIIRVDILPEEVALRYGYRADQRVVNFVLRRRFNAVTAEAEGGLATAGGRENVELDLDYLRITPDGRLNLDVEYRHAEGLLESERDLPGELAPFRTLLPETDGLSLNGTINRTLSGDVSTTLNARLDANDSRSLFGLRSDGSRDLLEREASTRNGRVGLSMNGDLRPWRWSLTAGYDRNRSLILTDDRADEALGRDRALSTSSNANGELVASGPLFPLPAGEVRTAVRTGFSMLDFESVTDRSGFAQEVDLSRDRGTAQVNLDLPIASRRNDVLAAIGNLSLNANAEVERLSDFGTLRTLGGGVNWSLIGELSFIASFTDEDGAPSVQQLGNPVLTTPNVRVFDFVRGETVDVTTIEGGNPALTADNRRVWKLGMTVTPLSETDLSLTANYTDTSIRNPIQSFPAATAEIEAAFPDRFERDDAGRLTRIDTRPVNFARADREELRWGINFSKPLGPQGPPPGARRQARAEARAAGQGGGGARQGGGGARQGGGGGPRFGGGRFGGGRGGRLQLGLYHTWRLTDEILIREGVPELDLLNGSALGSRGGRPRHEIEFQSGLFKDGLGARLTGTWQSGTTVFSREDVPGSVGDLRFSDFMTVNLRLFADLGAQRSLVRKAPWLRGTRVSLVVDNLFDSRLRVTDAAGATPISYSPAYLDPLGRSVRISIRKLFF